MGFLNTVLDESVAYGFEGGPRYLTDLVDKENGTEVADSKWIYPKHEYSAQFDNLKDDARDYIINAFHACRGKRHAFKFKDWNDFVIANQVIEVEVGTMNPIQLYKTYEFGQAFTVRPIQALVPGECEILLDGVTTVTGTLDNENGTFTPSANWTSGEYTLSCEFYVWVRFDNDYNSFTINSWQASTADVQLIERKKVITATNMPLSWEE